MTVIRPESAFDVTARDALLDAAFGIARRSKTSERLREGRLAAEGLSFVAVDDDKRLVGTVRLWHVAIGPHRHALLLGPLAVGADARCKGVGAALIGYAMDAACAKGHTAMILVGDAPYYGRFGFTAERTGSLRLPGPFETHRLLGKELVPGALLGAAGLVRPTGRRVPKPPVARIARSGQRVRKAA